MQEMPEVLLSFVSYKRTIQNRSALTVEQYAGDLEMFFRHVISERNRIPMEKTDLAAVDEEFIKSIKPGDIYAFLLYLSNDRKDKSRTVARKLSAIKSFFKYHSAKTRIVKDNPARDIDAPQIRPALPKYMSLDESVNLLDTVDPASPDYARDYCILTLFLNCGMRLSELVGINLADIDSDLSKLRVTGKGSKMRVVYLNESCRDAISAYLPVRSEKSSKCRVPLATDSKDALFLSKRNRRISPQTVEWLVYKYLDRAGLGGRGLSTHKLRHTAATLMYNEGGVDVLTLKDILGHEQLSTTQIYTHVSDQKLASAMDANPLAKRGRKNVKKEDNGK
ncbi:MAG: tyrosine recombinase XerC [Clostridia bacterium]|nr:tyrosine recombinase XerC [Clostridia bacterium]